MSSLIPKALPSCRFLHFRKNRVNFSISPSIAPRIGISQQQSFSSQQSTLASSNHTVRGTMAPSAANGDGLSFRVNRRYSTGIAVDNMPSFAFAFDIDGVLLRSSDPINGAIKTLQFLYRNNIPFIFLTNGGGKHESARVQELSKKLNVPLTEDNFVQSHTPFKQLVEDTDKAGGLKEKTILVTGGIGDKCRDVAEQYGFQNVVTSADILKAQPSIWPFNQIFTDFYNATARPLTTPINHRDPANSLKIDAVFVYSSPRDWALDTQIILDLLLSKDGILGTVSKKNGDASLPNNGWQQDGQPPIYFSNPDLFWATNHHMSRLGQGGFQAALEGVWHATTDGAELRATTIGKPSQDTYSYAEIVLNEYRSKLLSGKGRNRRRVCKLERVFMVGDNPESDIRGANSFSSPNGVDWSSILVKTGVFQAGSKPAYKPKVIVDDVLAAVQWALETERWQGEKLVK